MKKVTIEKLRRQRRMKEKHYGKNNIKESNSIVKAGFDVYLEGDEYGGPSKQALFNWIHKMQKKYPGLGYDVDSVKTPVESGNSGYVIFFGPRNMMEKFSEIEFDEELEVFII